MKIVLIDNYDSFTFNVYHYLKNLKCTVKVLRNDKFTLEQIKNFDKIVISPGPGNPDSAGKCLDLIKYFYKQKPILGICLGHQALAQTFGAKIIKAKKLMHGKISLIKSKRVGILKNLPNSFEATRYHSLIIDKKTLSKDLEITAETDDGVVMGIQHKEFNIHGVQFHPESIKTKLGLKILQNFINN